MLKSILKAGVVATVILSALINVTAEARISTGKRPLQTYTFKKVYCGRNPGSTASNLWIDANVDLVKITNYSGNWAYGQYPTSKGTLTQNWFDMSNVLYNINYPNWTGTSNRAQYVYRMYSGTSTIGSVPAGEPLEVVSECNGRYQVIYVLANGSGYKMGWVPASYVNKPVPVPAPAPRPTPTPTPAPAPANISRSGYAYPLGSPTNFFDNTGLGYPHDFIISEGSPVYAINDGTVYYYQVIGNFNGRYDTTVSYGNVAYFVRGGVGAKYAHLKDFNGYNLKYPGTNNKDSTYTKATNRRYIYIGSRNVKRGDIIAHVGNVGNSTDPHLHFEFIDHAKISGMGTSAPSINPGERLNINYYFSNLSVSSPYVK